MAIAESLQRRLGMLLRRAPQTESATVGIVAENLPVCPISEGDDQTGGIDLAISQELHPIVVRIVGSRDPLTGKIVSYHQEVHGQTYKVMPLAPKQEEFIQ
jgi:hypothetical protein